MLRLDPTCCVQMKIIALILALLTVSFVALGHAGDAPSKLTGSLFENSLGMRFVPVEIVGGPTNGQRVWFSIWETRVQDYAEFIKANGFTAGWNATDAPRNPAVMATWQDSRSFCEWLTKRERASGILGSQDEYRLPTDHEWSCAAGIGRQENAEASPESKSDGIPGVYPWGKQWPPPRYYGNFTPVYNRTFLLTQWPSPVTLAAVGHYSFRRNGLYDLVGSVYQWCEDWYNDKHQWRVLRGSWDSGDKTSLLSSHRVANEPCARWVCNGFRCVLINTGSPSPAK